jgi:hypothetical protein
MISAGAKLFMSGDSAFPCHFICRLYQLLTAAKLTHLLLTVLNERIFPRTSTGIRKQYPPCKQSDARYSTQQRPHM